MEKLEYESPRFEFQEMQLMEKVADDCWGTGSVWYDFDKSGEIEPDERLDFLQQGQGHCKDNMNQLISWLKQNGYVYKEEDVKTNVQKGTMFNPS